MPTSSLVQSWGSLCAAIAAWQMPPALAGRIIDLRLIDAVTGFPTPHHHLRFQREGQTIAALRLAASPDPAQQTALDSVEWTRLAPSLHDAAVSHFLPWSLPLRAAFRELAATTIVVDTIDAVVDEADDARPTPSPRARPAIAPERLGIGFRWRSHPEAPWRQGSLALPPMAGHGNADAMPTALARTLAMRARRAAPSGPRLPVRQIIGSHRTDRASIRIGDVLRRRARNDLRCLAVSHHPVLTVRQGSDRRWRVLTAPLHATPACGPFDFESFFMPDAMPDETPSASPSPAPGVHAPSAATAPATTTTTAAPTAVTLTFELNRLPMALAELQRLRPGDIIPLPEGSQDEPVNILIDGQAVGQGRLVRVGDFDGVQVIAWHQP